MVIHPHRITPKTLRQDLNGLGHPISSLTKTHTKMCLIVLVQTSKYMYSISNLVALRHFAAHGQATSKEVAKNSYAFGYIDYEILEQFPLLLANGLESYWHELQSSDILCNNLAKADIIALRKLPVFLSWSMFEKDSEGIYHSVAEIFRKFSWKV